MRKQIELLLLKAKKGILVSYYYFVISFWKTLPSIIGALVYMAANNRRWLVFVTFIEISMITSVLAYFLDYRYALSSSLGLLSFNMYLLVLLIWFPKKHEEIIAFSRSMLKFIWSVSFEKNAAGIQKPPGSSLDKFAYIFFSKKTYDQIYQPTICDMQDEYCEALAAEQLLKARIVRVRGYFSFFSAMVAHIPLSGLQLVKKIWTIVG